MTPALFGRHHPAGILRSEIVRATESHGGLVLVTGEAGIGKTTLVTDAAHEARRRGALVVGGSCWDSDSTPGYWPWVQVLRGLRRSATAAEWASAQEASDGRLGILLGDPGSDGRVEGGGAGVQTAGATGAAGPVGAARAADGEGPGAGAAGSSGSAGVSGVSGVSGSADASGSGSVSGSVGVSGSAGGTPDGVEAFGLYDAVTTALVTVSQSRPLVVVLDDLHSADPASLRLLEFAAQHAWFERLLLIGTYRDVEVEAPGHPLQHLILPLVSRASATLTLTGLARDEVGALLSVTTGREPAPHLVDEVHRRTGGNPFFVEQTARLWHSGSPVSTIPPGVREAVRQRLSLLPGEVVSLLTAAAVLGREFRRQVLAVVHGSPVPRVERLLESAIIARVVVPRPSGNYAFAHDLLRETLYASLGEAEARRRHAAAVRALDAHGGLDDSVRPGDLARHAHLAGGELERDRRIDLLLAAARDASGRLADEEATGHYRRALAVASGDEGEAGDDGEEAGTGAESGARARAAGVTGAAAPGGAPGRWADGLPARDRRRVALICLDLGEHLRHTGEPAEGERLLDRAVALARELDDPELVARVAITLHRQGAFGGSEAFMVAFLSEAHRKVTGKDGQDSLSADRLAQELAIHIMALARDGSDDEALAFSLWARHDSVWGLGSAVERLGLTDEMAVVGRRTQNLDMELHAASMRWVTLLELGDPAFIDQYRTFIRAAERSELPRFALAIAVDSSLIASLQGRFDEAAAALRDEVLGPQDREHEAFGFMRSHLRWSLYLLQGRFAEAEKVLAALPGVRYPYPRLLEALTAVEQGDAAPALRLIAEQSDRPAAPYPRVFMPLWLRLLAQTAAATGDRHLIARAEDELTPYTGQWIVSLYGCDIGGPVDLWLGMLAAARHDRDAAVAALTEATASADRLGARPWAVRSRLDLARSLLARAEPGDTGRARAILTEAEREAAELGLHHVASEAASIRTAPWAAGRPTTAASPELTPPAPAPPAAISTAATNTAPGLPTPDTDSTSTTSTTPSRPASGSGSGFDAAPAAEFRRDGPVWQLRWDGRTVHMPDAKGLRDLHSLLGLPGADVPAVRLLAPEGGRAVVAAGRLGGDPVLDEEAKRRYKEHLDRLDAEIDRAAARDDTRQVEAYDRERQALLDQLRTAAGLGGRSRRLGDQTERARKTVTARIRDTLRKLDSLHPELAAHLRESVTTGTTCAYRPARVPDWRL
ncbi:AAA family ATPase [Streptomyces cavourensis]|uniref:AAA family ATPase n=1 Tax=Streptomyces cavourensis TaxID=67258 RepID=UPI0020C94D53|nr:AAA family ATPase [Streptomyces cavourensis]